MKRLRQLAPAQRLLVAGLAVSLAATFSLGEWLIYRDNAGADGDPALSVHDLQVRFGGSHKSLLEARVAGEMHQYLHNDAEAATLLSWARSGGGRAGFDRDVSTILEDRCVRCHDAAGEAGFRPLRTFAQVQAVVAAPPAPSLRRQLLITKIHLFGLSILIALLGAMVTATGLAPALQTLLIGGALSGLAVDFASWWLMRVHLSFAWGRAGGNVLMSLCVLVMCGAIAVELLRSPRVES